MLSLGQHRTWKRICVSWSRYSASVDKQCESKCPVLQSVDAKVCSYGVRAKTGDRVLDLCCGSGDLAFLLSQKVGLDGEVGIGFAYTIFRVQISQAILFFPTGNLITICTQMKQVMAVDFSRQQLQTAADRQEQRWKLCYKNIK